MFSFFYFRRKYTRVRKVNFLFLGIWFDVFFFFAQSKYRKIKDRLRKWTNDEVFAFHILRARFRFFPFIRRSVCVLFPKQLEREKWVWGVGTEMSEKIKEMVQHELPNLSVSMAVSRGLNTKAATLVSRMLRSHVCSKNSIKIFVLYKFCTERRL